MRRIIGCVTVLLLAGIARGQDVKPDDMKKLLNETQAGLKTAQNRLVELATENGKLAARITELDKINKAQAAQLDDMKRKAAVFADRTLFLSTQYAAWVQFINANPAVKMQWEIFEETTAAVNAPSSSPIFMDTDWPLSVKQ